MNTDIRITDPITGLLNRIGGLEATDRLVAAASAAGKPLAALWLDLDRFRQVNESFGHQGGDNVIARIAVRIRERVGDDCVISRMGSDEFVCLVPDMHRDAAQALATALLKDIEEPIQVDNILFRPSASIGIALHAEARDALALLQHADHAMIEAKRQGGNRLVISGEEPVPGRLGVLLAREELVIENDLHTALETGGLQLHYQPIIGVDGRIEAVEALMRCTVDRRQIPPGKFIPVAEKTGLVVRLGEWSMLQGARYAMRLYGSGLRTKVAINVSRAQLTSPKFLQALHAALICADVPPELLEVELTESLFMDLSETVQTNLRSVRDIGVGLAIDDFGTGYSCLSNLKDLPATKLKLDRAFVCVLPEDRRAFSVVKAMTQLGRELGMTVVAEGVETQAQEDALLEAGVDAIQGFLHARPMDEEALFEWYRRRMSK